MFEQPEFQGPRECPVCLLTLGQSYGCRDDRTIQFADGEVREPVPYGEEEQYQPFDAQPIAACDKCRAMPGYLHHPGCPSEQCPNCGELYQACGCSTDEKLRISADWMTQERGHHAHR